jgi:poly[(R)-3-hydroxyalkanoate] polymerase subunit PhaC
VAGKDAQIIKYPVEFGVGLQHLGIFIGREAHAQVSPKIFSWIEAKQTREKQRAV